MDRNRPDSTSTPDAPHRARASRLRHDAGPQSDVQTAPELDPERSWFRAAAETRSAIIEAKPRVTLILPALNEADGLSVVLPRIPEIVDDVIVVNGPSHDRTVEVVKGLRPDAIIVQQLGRGKGNAIKHGLAVADGDIFVTMDADGSMNPEDIHVFVAALTDGADFVKGSRILPGGGSSDFTLLRRLGNDGLTRLANAVFGATYTDITYGFNAYWRWTIRHLGLLADGFEFEIQAAIRAVVVGMRTAEVPTLEPARVGGVSKLNPFVDGMAILRVLAAEASPRRAAQLGAAYEAEEQRVRGLLRARLLDPENGRDTAVTRYLESA